MAREVTFSPIGRDDLAAISHVETRCHSHPWSLATLASCLNQRYLAFKMFDQQLLCGFYIAELMFDELTLMDICVAPELQGNGYGHQLLQHFLQQGNAHHCQQAILEVRASNTAAIGLYKYYQFEQIAVRKNYYPTDEGREDALLMKYQFDVGKEE